MWDELGNGKKSGWASRPYVSVGPERHSLIDCADQEKGSAMKVITIMNGTFRRDHVGASGLEAPWANPGTGRGFGDHDL